MPTPQVTESIDVAWAPLAPNKNRVYRIGTKLTLENDYKQDILKKDPPPPKKKNIYIYSSGLLEHEIFFRFWNEDIPALFNKKPKKGAKKTKDEL